MSDTGHPLDLAAIAAYEAFGLSSVDRIGEMPPWCNLPDEVRADWRAVADAVQMCAEMRATAAEPAAPEPPARAAALTKLSAKRRSVTPERPPGQNQCPAIMPGPPPAVGEYRCELGAGHGFAHCFAGIRWDATP